jgi:6-phosphogluconate dehydrogenase
MRTDRDGDAGVALVDQILDRSGSKGTGMWTVTEALRRGVAVPTIAAALDGRYLSAMKTERERASRVLRGPDRPLFGPSWLLRPSSAGAGDAGSGPERRPPQSGPPPLAEWGGNDAPSASLSADQRALVAAVGDALFCSKLCSYAQGLSLLQRASAELGWSLNLAELARIWKGGCIIRARLLERIEAAYRREPDLANLLLDEQLAADIARRQDGWRVCVALAAAHGVPAPALTASLSYYDTYRRDVLRSSQLVQAQRDCFGSHTYERLDQPGRVWHTRWGDDGHSVEVSS